jgi:hypothetical protein
MVQVDESQWEQCADAAGGGPAAAPAAGIPGYDTSSPTGGAEAAEGSGSDSPVIITASGIQCQLPLNYNGVQVGLCDAGRAACTA